MSPYLELVDIKERDSFKVWTHGYPYETVRWHFHPEYEINLITETSGPRNSGRAASALTVSTRRSR